MRRCSPPSLQRYSAGSASHYAGMIFNQKAGLDFQHVPFPGSPPALQQLMGGQGFGAPV